jgi:hypothetical protein
MFRPREVIIRIVLEYFKRDIPNCTYWKRELISYTIYSQFLAFLLIHVKIVVSDGHLFISVSIRRHPTGCIIEKNIYKRHIKLYFLPHSKTFTASTIVFIRLLSSGKKQHVVSTVTHRLTKIIRSGITFVSRNVISRRFL